MTIKEEEEEEEEEEERSCNSYRNSQQDATAYPNFIFPYLYEAQHVSGDTPPIIRNSYLH
jgi:hypothetical protein